MFLSKMTVLYRQRVLFSIALSLWLPIAAKAAFSTIVDYGDDDCYVIRAPSKYKSTIRGNYDLLDDELSPDPFAVALYNSEDLLLWKSDKGESEGSFSIEDAEGGKYWLCFQNGIEKDTDEMTEDDGQARHVGFAVRISRPNRAMADESQQGPDEEQRLTLLLSTERIWLDLLDLMDHQGYLSDRESLYRGMIESTFTRIVRWTVLEAMVLIFIASAQVMYLRRFFEKKRYL